MSKFNGLLLVSDFDNTLVYTEEALQKCVDMPPVSEENRAAIEYFMANGGTFSVATGRAKPAFETVVDGIPMNGPTVLFNGAAIYDFSRREYLVTAFLPDDVRPRIEEVVTDLPQVAVELYHDDNTIHALNANDVTRRHMHITHAPTIEVGSMDQVPAPISKALFSTEEAHLPELLAYLKAQPWYNDYELVPSAVTLVELTAKGANKGGMVSRLAQLLGVRRENVLCVGDHANDVSMLTWAGEGYAPANAIPLVLDTPGVRRLPDCRENAIAALIRDLDRRF
jgi:Cof subfamily protein (haloacid dehalogenase superfamily)